MGMLKPFYGKMSMRKQGSQKIGTRLHLDSVPSGHEGDSNEFIVAHPLSSLSPTRSPFKHVRFQADSDAKKGQFASKDDLRALHEAQLELMRTHEELLHLENEIRVARLK